MTELALQWWLLPKGLLLVVWAWLYAWGGLQHKWLRRWVGSSVLAGGFITLSLCLRTFRWHFLSSLVIYPIALSLGYGGDTLGEKLKRRASYGLALGACSLTFVSTIPTLHLALIQTALSVCISVVLGVWNPTTARAEEFCIGFGSTFLTVGMI